MNLKKYLFVSLILLLISSYTSSYTYANNNESFIQKEKNEKILIEKNLPDDLKDWVDWTTYDYKKNNCDYKFDNKNEKYCYYISELDITINEKNLAFKESVLMMDDGYIKLPGSLSVFPIRASIQNKNIPIINIDGFPYLFLEKGEYVIDGFAKSKDNIRSLNIPKNVAIINVNKNDKKINFINIDSNGVLRFDGNTDKKEKNNDINILAFRKIEDTIPIKMTLRIDLNVSGKDRIEIFKNVIPENFSVLSVNSNIPVYIQKNGDLVAEVRAGRWSIDIEFRQIKESLNFSTKNLIKDEEIWVFVGNQNRRIIQMPNNMISIQTKNTLLPEDWKKYPAYQINKNNDISLTSTKYNIPQKDDLELIRNIKQSFNGEFYSIKDNIKGIFRSDERMYLESPFNLSSLEIMGIAQPITKIKNEDLIGFEVRKGNADITTISRINKGNDEFFASGYNKIFNNVKWNLTLAPGYELFYVSGADFISNSWITNWNLLNIFTIILLVVFIYYLFNIKKALLSAIFLVLIHPLLPELSIISFVLCGTILLDRYIVENGITHKINTFIRYTLLIFLSITIISFMIINIRWSIYPALAEPKMNEYFSNFINLKFLLIFYIISATIFILSIAFNKKNEKHLSKIIKIIGIIIIAIYILDISIIKKTYYKNIDNTSDFYVEDEYDIKTKINNPIETNKKMLGSINSRSSLLLNSAEQTNDSIQYENQNIFKNKIQTGVGFPDWESKSTINIELKGPVNNNDKFNIYLISPKINIILSFIRLFLGIYFIYFMTDINRNNFKNKMYSFKKVILNFLIILFVGLSFNNANATTELEITTQKNYIPDKNILNELKEKLTKEKIPSCIPYCVSIPNGKISNIGDNIILDLSINSADNVVIPLPIIRSDNSNSVKIEKITNNEKDVKNIIREGDNIFLKLNSGINNISIKLLLDSSLNNFFLYSIFNIPYLVDNLKDFKIITNENKNQNFQIVRNKLEENTNNKKTSYSKINIESFFTINRFFNIGTNWQVKTIILRNNNINESATIKIPLLKNEKVLTNEGVITENNITLSFLPNEIRKEFTSIIPVKNEIILQYPKDPLNYNEIWNFKIDFNWNFKIEGLQPIVSDNSQTIFYPSSGDKLKLIITQPENVNGNTLTFNNVIYQFKPGRSVQEINLNLDIKSSETGYHNITLPKNSEIKNLKINQNNYPVILKDNQLTFPVNQGITNVNLTLNINDKITNLLKFPTLNLNAPIVNITQEAFIPISRWILFTNGPIMGPSVLFWAQIPIWLCIAFILSRFKIFPLNFLQWFILLVGFMQTNIIFTIITIAWFISFALKEKYFNFSESKKIINIFIIFLTLLFIYSLFKGISNGLLGTWNMKILGNNSQLIYNNENILWNLKWYQDISSGELPKPLIFSLPIVIYRIIMILWSIWLSSSFIRWIKWAFNIIK